MSRLPWIVFGFAPSRTRTVRRPSLLQAPTVCRAEFDCKSRPTITKSGSSLRARARRNSRLRSLLPPRARLVRSSRLIKILGAGAPQSARARFGASVKGVGLAMRETRGIRAICSRIVAKLVGGAAG